jgi:hypothetical protein
VGKLIDSQGAGVYSRAQFPPFMGFVLCDQGKEGWGEAEKGDSLGLRRGGGRAVRASMRKVRS